MLFMQNFEKIQSLQVHIEVTHIKKILFQKAVKKVDDVLENENQNTNYDLLQIYGKLQMNRNFYPNIKNIMTDYTIMRTCTDFTKVTRIEENLIDTIQNHDTEDIYESTQQLNYTKKT